VATGLFVAIYFPCSRYRVPVLPLVVVLAVAGAQALGAAWRARAWSPAVAHTGLLLAAVAAVNLPLAWPTDRIRYDAHLWNAMGVAADVRRDLGTARRCYEEAVRRDSRLADAQFNLGTVYTRLKDALRAETCYEAAVTARADHDKARVNLGISLADRGKMKEALHQFTMAEALNPLNAEAFANHAAVLQRAGRQEEAVAMLRQAAKLEQRYRALCHALERQAASR
jgi:tetratricopeptide (TPR) repeat protein